MNEAYENAENAKADTETADAAKERTGSTAAAEIPVPGTDAADGSAGAADASFQDKNGEEAEGLSDRNNSEAEEQNDDFSGEPPAKAEAESGRNACGTVSASPDALRKAAGKARFSFAAGMALLCLFCSLLAGGLGVFVGLKMSNTSLTFDAIVRRVKANTGDGPSDGTVAQITANAAPSVVTVQVSFDDKTAAAASSGVVIARDGSTYYIVCCAHGVVGYPYLRIRTEDGTDYRAETVGADRKTDLAVLKVTAPDLCIALPGGDAPVMGESIVVLGNPLGSIGISAAFGIVSRPLCTVKAGDITQDLMKLDCAVNPGNSGGGVFDMEGHLIGIVSAKITEYEGVTAEGMAFAIPMETVTATVAELTEHGYVAGRPSLGLSFTVTPGADGRYSPLTVSDTLYAQDGETPLLLSGDILLSASYTNGRSKTIYPAHTSAVNITSADALTNLQTLVACGEVGDTLKLTVKRGTDTPFEVVVTLRAADAKADV